MSRSISSLLLVAALCCAPALCCPATAAEEKESKPTEPAEVDLGRPVSFEKDIQDIFDLNCVACHYEGGAESRLVLEDATGMLKGGKRGPGIVPGKPDESLIYLVAARKKAPHMPPLPNEVEAKALTPKELGLLRQWIQEGAEAEGIETGTQVDWQPIPSGMNAGYAVALSPWSDRVAAGRANQISVFGIDTGEEARLIDPNLSSIEHEDGKMYPDGAAHRDFVHSLAFHPSGRMLASGGFRVVKLWERPTNVQTRKISLGGAATDVEVNVEKQLAAFGTQQKTVTVRSLADGQEVAKLSGHSGPVTGVALTADGTQVVSGSPDKSIRIWSVDSGKTTRQIDTPAPINDICLSGDGKLIVSAHEDNVIRVWNFAAPEKKPAEGDKAVEGDKAEEAKPEQPVRELKGHSKPVRSVALILPDGQQIVSGADDNTVRIWNLSNGSTTRTMNHGGPVVSVAARPDGEVVASASSNNTAKLWTVSNGKEIAELRGVLAAQREEQQAKEQADLAKQLVSLADKAQKTAEKRAKERAEALKTATEEKEKAVKAVEEQKKKYDEAKAKADEGRKKLEAAQKAAEEAAAKAEEAKKAFEAKKDDDNLKKAADEAAAEAKKLKDALKAPTDAQKKLDEELKKQEDELKKQEEALKSATRSLELATKADAKAKKEVEETKAAHTEAQEDQKARDEAYKKAQESAKAAEKPFTAVAFSNDGKRVATAAEDGLITIWSADNGAPLESIRGDGGPIRTLAFASDNRLISAGDDQTAIVWDANPGWKLAAHLGAPADDPLNIASSPFEFRVLSLAFSPDGSLLATGGGEPSRSGELMIWDVEKREMLREIEDAHSDTVFGLEFSRDGKRIVSGAADKFVKIHEVDTGKHIRSFEGHTHHVMDVSWQADGSALASAGADNVIKVWNVETGEQIRTIKGYSKQITSIEFAGISGNTISCGGDKSVRLHTASNGRNYRSFSGGTDFMYCADASRDEKIIVATGEDGVVRVWDGSNGKALHSFEPPAVEESAQATASK